MGVGTQRLSHDEEVLAVKCKVTWSQQEYGPENITRTRNRPLSQSPVPLLRLTQCGFSDSRGTGSAVIFPTFFRVCIDYPAYISEGLLMCEGGICRGRTHSLRFIR